MEKTPDRLDETDLYGDFLDSLVESLREFCSPPRDTCSEDLLEEWKAQPHHRDAVFIRDGIIDDIRWGSVRPRVLFLLKESRYGEPGNPGNCDLRRWIRRWGPHGSTYWNAARWAYLAHEIPRVGSIPEFPDWRILSDPFKASAVVNLKKSSGKASSNDENLKDYVYRDGDFIRRQVELIDPDLVICGSTWFLVEHLWPEDPQNPNDGRLYDGVHRRGECVFVDFWHPANRYPNTMNYYALGALLWASGALERFRAPSEE